MHHINGNTKQKDRINPKSETQKREGEKKEKKKEEKENESKSFSAQLEQNIIQLTPCHD